MKKDEKVNKKVVQGEAGGETGAEAAVGTEIAELTEKVAELTADLQRTRADFENYRKQVDLQRAQAMEVAREETVRKVLPLIDNLDLAINAHEQLKPLEKSLEKTMREMGLEKIATAAGTEFNPDLHEAVMMEEGEGEREVVVETLRAGYLYGGRVVRAAMVKVGRE